MSQVTSYGGELRFTVTQRPQPGSAALHRQPLVVLQGNNIILEHHTSQEPSPGQPSTFTVPFREVSNAIPGDPGGGAGRPPAPLTQVSGCQGLQPISSFLGSKHGSGLTGSRPRGSTC